jgi:hypothetical protein
MKGNRRTVPATYTADDIIGGEFYDLYSNPKADKKTLEKMKIELLAFLKNLQKLT